MLQGLGEAETRSVLAERGEVEVHCDFCNRAYVFDAVDVAQLFNAGVVERQWPVASLSGFSLSCAAIAAVQAAGAGDAPFYADTFGRIPAAAAMTDVGRALFFDASLSASGKMSCATCHDPKHAFRAGERCAVQRGGSNGQRDGLRAVPSFSTRKTRQPSRSIISTMTGTTASIKARPAGEPGTAGHNRRTIRRACLCFRRSKWRMPASTRCSPRCGARAMRPSFARRSARMCSTTRRGVQGGADGLRGVSAKSRGFLSVQQQVRLVAET